MFVFLLFPRLMILLISLIGSHWVGNEGKHSTRVYSASCGHSRPSGRSLLCQLTTAIFFHAENAGVSAGLLHKGGHFNIHSMFGGGTEGCTYCFLPPNLTCCYVGVGSLTFTYCGDIVDHVSLSVCNLWTRERAWPTQLTKVFRYHTTYLLYFNLGSDPRHMIYVHLIGVCSWGLRFRVCTDSASCCSHHFNLKFSPSQLKLYPFCSSVLAISPFHPHSLWSISTQFSTPHHRHLYFILMVDIAREWVIEVERMRVWRCIGV